MRGSSRGLHSEELHKLSASRRSWEFFFFTTASRTALGPTQPPIQWVPGALSLGVKRPVREADHSPPSSAEVKNAWSYTSTPQYVFMAWCLVKHRDHIKENEVGGICSTHWRYEECVRDFGWKT
jgi:hypothetical protein